MLPAARGLGTGTSPLFSKTSISRRSKSNSRQNGLYILTTTRRSRINTALVLDRGISMLRYSIPSRAQIRSITGVHRDTSLNTEVQSAQVSIGGSRNPSTLRNSIPLEQQRIRVKCVPPEPERHVGRQPTQLSALRVRMIRGIVISLGKPHQVTEACTFSRVTRLANSTAIAKSSEVYPRIPAWD